MAFIPEKTKEERLEEYENLVQESVLYWLPKLTIFKDDNEAPPHTQYHMQLIVDAVLKSIEPEGRVSDFFLQRDRKLNFEQLQKQVMQKKFNPEQASTAQKLLNKFIEYVGSTLNWSSARPIQDTVVLPRVLPVIREKQMFNSGLGVYYHQAIEEGLGRIQDLSDGALIGLVTLSAIFDSNILHASQLKALLKVDRESFNQFGDQVVRVRVDDGELPVHFLKIHTKTLVALVEVVRRFPAKTSGDSKVYETADLQKPIKKLLKLFCWPQGLELPTSLSQILEVASALYFINRPAFFHAVMTQKLSYAPLPDEAKVRILTGTAVERLSKNDDQPLQPEGVPHLTVEESEYLDEHELPASSESNSEQLIEVSGLSEQFKSIKRILKSLVPLSKGRSIQLLDSLLNTPPPYLSLMSIWLISWLRHLYGKEPGQSISRKQTRSNLKTSSIMRYFRSVYGPMLSVFDNMDTANLEEDEWMELLQDAVNSSKDREIGKHLGTFISFLQSHHNLMVLPLYELEGTDLGSRVNADLLTPYEGYEILNFLLDSTYGYGVVSLDRKIQACAFILGYFCGLRRNEALGLRVIDIYGHPERPVLFVRSHEGRGLKRTYSRRRIELADFVPETYLKVLMGWHHFRDGSKAKYLLNVYADGMAPDTDVIDPVQSYCRQVTGDQSFVFHGLRHCFANLYMLRIMQLHKPELGVWFGGAKLNKLSSTPLLKEVTNFYSVDNSTLFVRKYFRSENQLMPRSSLLQLSGLLGHKVPDTTCKSYLHLIYEMETAYFEPTKSKLLESVLDQFWCFPEDRPSQKSRFKKKLLNSSKSIDEHKLAFQLVKNVTGVELKEVSGVKFVPKKLEWYEPVTLVQFDLENLSNNVEVLRVLRVLYQVLKSLFIFRSQTTVVAGTFALPLVLVEKIQQNVLSISRLKTTKKHDRFRHPRVLRRSNKLEQDLGRLMTRLAKHNLKGETVNEGLTLYLKRAQKNRMYRVRLLDVEEFKSYFLMLKSLTVANTQIGLRVFPSSYHQKTDEELKAYWTRVFQDTASTREEPLIQIQSPITCANEFGNVELEPIKKLGDGEYEVLEHHQYAIYMLAVIFLEELG